VLLVHDYDDDDGFLLRTPAFPLMGEPEVLVDDHVLDEVRVKFS
jgi:hypothetical protein